MSEVTDSTRGQELRFTVSNADQAQELHVAWHQIVAGTREADNRAAGDLSALLPAAEGLDEIMQRARTGLRKITAAIDANPGASQTIKLARFLAGLYDGHDYHFDLTALRDLDTDLASACIDYLNYDRLGRSTVQSQLAGGDTRLTGWVRAQGLLPRLRLSQPDEHANRLSGMARRAGRQPDQLLRDALDDFLGRYEARTFGALLVADHRAQEQPTVMHAYRLAEPRIRPLCDATDGSWSPRPFDFARLNCAACKAALWDPDPG